MDRLTIHYYQAFGLNFSADFKIFEFIAAPHIKHSIDVVIAAGNIPEIHPIAESTAILLDIKQVARFLITEGNRITYQCDPNVNVDELRLFLLGSCMGALLQQRGDIVLHGNAISIDGKNATLFVGHSGAGKSTMAAWHAKQNHRILADDVCAIRFDNNQTAKVMPSYPQIKLWQHAADLLKINTDSLRRIRPQDLKFALPIHKQFQMQPLSLKQIIEIDPQTLRARTLTGVEKFKCLAEHTYRPHFLKQMNLQSSYNKQLMRLIQRVEMKKTCRKKLI